MEPSKPQEPSQGPRGTDADLAAFEARHRARRKRLRVAGAILAGMALAGVAVMVVALGSRRDPGPAPLERALTARLTDLQLAWFDTRATGLGERSRDARARAFDEAAGAFLEDVGSAVDDLRPAFEPLVAWMRESAGQPGVEVRDPTDLLRPVNEALARQSPPFVLEPEPFTGVLGDGALRGVMLVVFQVLGERCFRAGDGDPVRIRVVRRSDALPAATSREGYVRTKDVSAAFVLQDEATMHAAESLLPGRHDALATYLERFGDVDKDFREPWMVLLDRGLSDLTRSVGASDDEMRRVAAPVARRVAILHRIRRRAEDLGIAVHFPDGLAWPPGVVEWLRRENAMLPHSEEPLASGQDLVDLERIRRDLDGEDLAPLVARIADFLVGGVAFHEARHVVDIRGAEAPVSACVADRMNLADPDDRFVKSVERETRAFATTLIEAPLAARTTVMDLLDHLYARHGTVYFYAARTLLHPLAFPDGREARDGPYMYAITKRLADLEPAELSRRARAWWESCYGSYVPLTACPAPAGP